MIGQTLGSVGDCINPNIESEQQYEWEEELEMIGAGASRDQLMCHYQKAPDKNSPIAIHLLQTIESLHGATYIQ